MPKFEVALKQISITYVDVFASSKEEAEILAKEDYENGDIASNFYTEVLDVETLHVEPTNEKIYLFRFLRKGDKSYTNRFVVATSDNAILEFHEINKTTALADSIFLEIPEDIAYIYGNTIELMEYDDAELQNPEWVKSHSYIW